MIGICASNKNARSGQKSPRGGLTRVLLPARNRHDFDEIAQGARDRRGFVWLERVDDAIGAALETTASTTTAAAEIGVIRDPTPCLTIALVF
jgi:hypothetical protein